MQNGHMDIQLDQDDDQVVVEINRNQIERFTGPIPAVAAWSCPKG